MKYSVKVDGQEYGPVDLQTICNWVCEDRILENTLIKNEDSSKWKKAILIPEIKNFFNGDYTIKEEVVDKKNINLENNAHHSNINIYNRVEAISDVAPNSTRIISGVIDSVCISCLILILWIGIIALLNKTNSTAVWIAPYLFIYTFVLALFMYFAFFISLKGQTIGMLICKIKMSMKYSDRFPSPLRVSSYLLLTILFTPINLVSKKALFDGVKVQERIAKVKIFRVY